MQQRWQRLKDICSAKKRDKKWKGVEGAARKTLLLKFPSTTNSKKLTTYHKQIKKVEPVRAEAIKQISKKVDFFHSTEMGEDQDF